MVRRKCKHIASNDPLPCAHTRPNLITKSDPVQFIIRSSYGLKRIKLQEVHTGINLRGNDLWMHMLGWENAELLFSVKSFVAF